MIKKLSKPFKWFFQLEAASGLVLIIAAIIALVISNSSLSKLYFEILQKYLFLVTPLISFFEQNIMVVSHTLETD